MSDREPQPGKGGDMVEQAREAVRREVREAEKAATEEEKRKQKETIAENVKKELEEAVGEIERIKQEGRSIEKPTEQKLVTSLAKALEAANQGILEVPDQAKELLTRVVRTNPSDATISAVGEYIGSYLLGVKPMVSDGKLTADFEKALDELRKVNPNAADLISLKIAEDPGRFGVLQSELKKLLTRATVNEELLEKANIGKKRGQVVISLDEMKRVENITHQIATLLSEKIKLQTINKDTIEEVNKAIISPVVTPELQETLIELGLSEEIVREYVDLKEKYFQFPDFSFLQGFAPGIAHLVEAAEKEFFDLSRFFSTKTESGSLELSRQMRLKFSELIKKYHYLILKPVIADRSKSFHENFSHHTEVQYALTILRQIISLSCEKISAILPEEGADGEMRDIINFFKDKGESFQSRIFTYASLFHDLPLYTRNLGSIEKIKEFLSFLFPSQLAEFFDDESGFMQMTRDVLTMMQREYLVEGKNQYRGDFLSGKYTEEGVRWNQWFRDEYEKRLKKLARKLNLLEKGDEWKLEMAIAFSEGVGVATLIDGEVLSTSDPVGHFKEVHPLMSFLSPKHNWQGGRGRDYPGRISRFLLHTDIKLFPEVRPWFKRIWSKKRWVPEEFADWVDKAIKTYGEKFVENFFDIGGSYQELLALFNLPNSLNSWNGWRIEGMMPTKLKSILGVLGLDKYGDFWRNKAADEFFTQWKEVIDYTGKIYGASGIWNSIGGAVGGAGVHRLSSELRRFLVDYYGGDVDKADLHFSEFFDEKVRNFGNRGRERIFTIGGQEGKLSLFEIRQIRLNQLRGEVFFRYLRRNPADFLMLTTQLCPELLEVDSDVFKSEQEIRNLSGKTRLEKEMILGRQKELRVRWGRNFETLKNLHRWLSEKKGDKSIVDFIKEFNEGVIEAYERHKTREEGIRREIVRIATDPKINAKEKRDKIGVLFNQLSFYLKEEDFGEEGKNFWQLFTEEDGLFKIITGTNFNQADEYFSKFGSYNHVGEMDNFFATMAHSWFIKNGDINPFAADVPYYDVFEQLGTPGESTFARLIDANIAVYKEIVSQITTLEDLLMEAAKTGKMEKIYELHKKIYTTLSGLVSPEYAFRANFVLAQVVSQFFMERSILRDPKWKLLGPIGWIAKEAFGKNISLSKLLTNDLHAYSMDNNALRTYLLYLTHDLKVLPEKGVWSKEHLEDVFEVTKGEFYAGDVAPTILWFIVLYLLFSYVKKVIEEVEGKKK